MLKRLKRLFRRQRRTLVTIAIEIEWNPNKENHPSKWLWGDDYHLDKVGKWKVIRTQDMH